MEKIRYQNVVYRNIYYKAIIKDWKYFIKNSKQKLIDITEKKFVKVPDGMSLVIFSLLYHSWKFLHSKK